MSKQLSAAAMVVVLWAIPAQAGAATTRYAAADGGGTAPCTNQANPCKLPAAASATNPGDTLVVAADTYQLSQTLVLQGVHVVGRPSFFSPRPRIVAPDGQVALYLIGGTMRDVALEGTGGTNWVLDATNATVERVVVKASGDQLDGIVLRGTATLRDSTAWTTGGGSAAGVLAIDGEFTLRNVTAWSTGTSSIGILVRANAKATQAYVRNTIASGTTDVYAIGKSSSIDVDVLMAYSYYDTKYEGQYDNISGGSNQQGAPALVNPGAGNFHQLASSPTRDSGVLNDIAAEETDLDGDRRVVGPKPDIGADEWTPIPTVGTDAATLIGATVATVTGSVTPNGGATTYVFQWGTTGGYGNPSGLAALFAARSAGNGTSALPVSLKLTGLTPSTTYHYRARAANQTGIGYGPNRTFTTGPPGTPDPGGSGPEPGQPGGAILTLTKVSVKPARFRVARRPTAVSARRRARRPVPRGTTFRYTLSDAATATIAIKRKLAGRRKRGLCVKPTRRLRRARRCTRLVAKGTLTRGSASGVNAVKFTGRVGRRKLAAGKYIAELQARDLAGNVSNPARLPFTVVPG